MLAITSLLVGLGFGGFAWTLVHLMTVPREIDPKLGYFEQERRTQLRAANTIYRLTEPWIDQLAAGRRAQHREDLDRLQTQLLAAGETLPWKPEEYLAVRQVEALLAAIGGALFGWLFSGLMFGVVMCIAAFVVYQMLAQRLLVGKAVKRQIQLKRRFAAAIDLMALMMEVGGGFQETLEVVTKESRGHPLGDEFAIIQRDIEHGRIRREALRDFAHRVADEDISEIVMSIVEGEELGTPLAKILRTQADQLRQKRTQWAEKAAEESQVALVFPAMVIMVACLITVAAPFVLSALETGRAN